MFKYTDNEQMKNELKKILIDNNMTAKEIADNIGVKPQQYNNIVNKRNFALSDLKRICDAMSCDLIIDIVPRNKIK